MIIKAENHFLVNMNHVFMVKIVSNNKVVCVCGDGELEVWIYQGNLESCKRLIDLIYAAREKGAACFSVPDFAAGRRCF